MHLLLRSLLNIENYTIIKTVLLYFAGYFKYLELFNVDYL